MPRSESKTIAGVAAVTAWAGLRSLDVGLRLEKRRRLLRWGRSPQQLRRIGRPRDCPGDIVFNYSPLLVWPDAVALGGLRSTVTTPLRARAFRRAQLLPHSQRPPGRLFHWVNAHLREVLNAEERLVDDGWCPRATWRIGPVRITSELRDKNGLFHVLLVERVVRAR